MVVVVVDTVAPEAGSGGGAKGVAGTVTGSGVASTLEGSVTGGGRLVDCATYPATVYHWLTSAGRTHRTWTRISRPKPGMRVSRACRTKALRGLARRLAKTLWHALQRSKGCSCLMWRSLQQKVQVRCPSRIDAVDPLLPSMLYSMQFLATLSIHHEVALEEEKPKGTQTIADPFWHTHAASVLSLQ